MKNPEYVPDKNRNHSKRPRSRFRYLCRRVVRDYRHGLPPQTQTNNNGQQSNELGIFDPNGKIASFKPVPIKGENGKDGQLVAHYGLPPEALPYLAVFL